MRRHGLRFRKQFLHLLSACGTEHREPRSHFSRTSNSYRSNDRGLIDRGVGFIEESFGLVGNGHDTGQDHCDDKGNCEGPSGMIYHEKPHLIVRIINRVTAVKDTKTPSRIIGRHSSTRGDPLSELPHRCLAGYCLDDGRTC